MDEKQAKPPTSKTVTEYILVADRTSKVVYSSTSLAQIKSYALFVRKGGGEVTVFKSTKY